jgi:hypothetical protein
MKCKWDCPQCEMSSTRHYNVERHIRRMHNGTGEPVNDRNVQYHGEMNRHNLRFPLDPFHHSSLSLLTQKEKPDQKFSDLLEDQFLQPLRKMAEFKNLLSELQPSFASTPSSSSNPAYHEVSSSNFGDVFCINNISNMFEKPFPPDSWITIGIKARVCENCFNEIYIPIFFKIEGKNEVFEPQHDCYEIDLHYSAEEKELLNVSNVNLTKQMMKLIKIWVQGENYLIVAKEISQQCSVIGDINADKHDHWSSRAIKDKFTTLKDDNELTDFLAKTKNSTFGLFKVYSSHQQQFSAAKFYLFMIIKKEWL